MINLKVFEIDFLIKKKNRQKRCGGFTGVVVRGGGDGYTEDVTMYRVFVHHVCMVRYHLPYALYQVS
jgi:hypothetical protein